MKTKRKSKLMSYSRVPKIKGMVTPSAYVDMQLESWYDTCGLPNKHFIDKNQLYDIMMKCVKHGQRFSNHLRKERNKVK